MTIGKDEARKLLLAENFSDEDVQEIISNFDHYGPVIDELKKVSEEYGEKTSAMTSLNSQYARLNYEIYEKFMAVHVNAIKISSKKSEVSLLGLTTPRHLAEKVETILEKYLLITDFL